MTMNRAFDKKNTEDYEKITQLITDALQSISSNSNLKVTIKQIVDLTGVHRNTISERNWPKESLDKIKEDRVKRQLTNKKEKVNQEQKLNEQIKQIKLELVHWFTTAKKLQNDLNQLQHTSDIMTENRDYYENELKKERLKVQELQNKNAILSQIIDTKED
jgi:hypothetical protein